MKPKPQILVVEDNEVDVRYLRGILAKAGIAVISHAWDGEQAIRELSRLADLFKSGQGPTHLVMLLDLMLPILDGFAVLNFIQQEPALQDIKVFVVTSSDDEHSRQRVAQAGAMGCIVKPLSLAHLAYILESIEVSVTR